MKTPRSIIRSVPIFGGLVDAKWTDHREAIAELSCAFIFSTLPIWGGALLMLFDRGNSASFWALLVITVMNGELFILATALFGSLFYIMYKEIKENTQAQRFPSPLFFLVLPVVISVISALLFAFRRAVDMFNLGPVLNNEGLFVCSVMIYLFSLLLIYLAHVYRNVMEHGAPTIQAHQTNDFVKEFGDRNN
jgi:hypothetical protein